MQIHTGTFGPSTIESNSLAANLLKFPEIQSKITELYPQYSLNYLMHKLNRYAKTVEIGDNSYRWPVMGRKTDPSVVDIGFVGATGVGSGFGTFNVDFDPSRRYCNKYDVVKLPDGQNAWVVDVNGSTVTFALQTSDPLATTDTTALSGLTIGKIGSMYPEGSKDSFGNVKYPDWHQNHLTIQRENFDITGDALTDILWVENNGQKLWFFKGEKDWMDEIYYRNEVFGWYNNSTMDVNGNPTQFDLLGGGKPIIAGDGIEAQIYPGNIDTYTGTLVEEQILEYATMLLYNCGSPKPTYLVLGGRAAQLAWTKAMRDYYIQAGAVVWNGSKSMEIGGSFHTYHALDATFILAHNPIQDDPNIWGNDMVNIGFGAYPRKSFDMYFLDISMMGQDSNLEYIVKSAGGINRSHVVKYIPGMVNPFDPKSVLAATKDDRFSIEYLCQTGWVLRNQQSCGMLQYA